MSIALKIAVVLQYGFGLFWTFVWASTAGRGDFGMLPLILATAVVQVPGFLLSLWALWRHPELRRWAIAGVVAPLVFWFLPGIVKNLAGGHLSAAESGGLLLIMLLVLFAACILVPRKVAGFVPDLLFRSRVFNGLILAGLVGGWLLLVGVFVFLSASKDGGYQGDTGYGLAYAIVILAIYLIGLGAGSLFSTVWAWLGLWSGVDGACRKLNIAQIVASVPGLLLGGLALAFVIQQGF